MSMPIILEKGYNTSGMYAFITSLFRYRSDSINRMINDDLSNISVIYVQEYIKSEFVTRLQSSKSLPVFLINRFRNILFNYGWRKNIKNDIDKLLADANPQDLHRFLISNIMESKLIIERVDSKLNTFDEMESVGIEIDTDCAEYYDTGCGEVLDLSESINSWVHKNVVEIDRYSFRFKEIPHLIPVFVDYPNNSIPVDVKQMIHFHSINDPVQKIFTWDVHSIVLYDVEAGYSALVKDDTDTWFIFSEATIPANTKIDMSDPIIVRKISRQIKVVYYKIK